MDVLVIGIAGGTGSGKTTLMKSLMGQFGEEITVLSHDNYYRPTTIFPMRSGASSITTNQRLLKQS